MSPVLKWLGVTKAWVPEGGTVTHTLSGRSGGGRSLASCGVFPVEVDEVWAQLDDRGQNQSEGEVIRESPSGFIAASSKSELFFSNAGHPGAVTTHKRDSLCEHELMWARPEG